MKNKLYSLILFMFPFFCSAQNVLCGGATNWFTCNVDSPLYHSGSFWVTMPNANGSGVLAGIKAASQMTSHLLALDTLNMVWGIGSGQGIGDSTILNHLNPVRTKGVNGAGVLTNVWKVSASSYHSLFLLQDSTVLACGSNTFGQLGDSTNSSRPYLNYVHGPGNVGKLNHIIEICAGWDYNLALRDDGSVWSWGLGAYGVLGNGMSECWFPIPVTGLTGIIDISTYAGHCLALRNDGTVWSWGQNTSGELGIGSFSHSYIPVQVHGINNVGFLQNVISISAGAQYSVALADDSSVYSWGYNLWGQLGDGTAFNRNIPVMVKGLYGVGFLNGVRKIVAGFEDTYAETNDGRIFGWGGYTMLAAGATVNTAYPVEILLPCMITEINTVDRNENSFNIFPNPNNGKFSMSCQGINQLNGTLRLYDLSGEVVFQSRITGVNEEFDLSFLAAGAYIIKFENEKVVYAEKVIVQ